MIESNITFKIGDHSSFSDGSEGKGKGSLNFLKYPDSSTLGLVVEDTNGTYYGFQVLRPIFFFRDNNNECNILDTSITSTSLIYEFTHYKVCPIFCEIQDDDESDSIIKYIFYYLQDVNNFNGKLTFYNPTEKMTIFMMGNVASYKIDDDSLSWVDF